MRSNFLVKTKRQTIARARIKYRNKDYDGSLLEWNDLLEREEDHAFGLMGKFDCLLKLDLKEQAMEMGELACEANMQSTATQNNFACLLMDRKEFDRAAVYFENAHKLKPDASIFCFNAGLANFHCKKYDQATQFFETVLDIEPQHDRAIEFLSLCYLYLGFNDEVVALSNRLLLIKPLHSPAAQRRYFAQLANSAMTDHEREIDIDMWQSMYATKYRRDKFTAVKLAGQSKLRIGWMLCDYAVTDVCRMIPALYPFLEAHNAELVGFSSKSMIGPYEDVLDGLVDELHIAESDDLKTLNLLAVSHSVDILIDTMGQVPNNLLLLFQHRLAKRQISWPFAPGKCGVSTMDYRLVNQELVESQTSQWGEKLEILQNGLAPYAPPANNLIISQSPALENQFVTFGFSGDLYQLNQQTLDCWAAILTATAKSRLIIASRYLPSELAEQNLTQTFLDAGISEDRLAFRYFDAVLQSDLSFYNDIDIFLNPFPYSNRLSLIDALWMGCPVIALNHPSLVSAVGIECLRAADAMDNVVNTVEEYVDQAGELAVNMENQPGLRKQMSLKTRNSKIAQSDALITELFGFFKQIAE